MSADEAWAKVCEIEDQLADAIALGNDRLHHELSEQLCLVRRNWRLISGRYIPEHIERSSRSQRI